MNIVFFVSGLDSGGLENYLLRFLQYKHSSFNKVFVYCKSGKGGQLEGQYLQLSNVEIIKNRIEYFDNKSMRKLKQFIVQNNIDALCDFTGNFAGRIMKASKKAGVKKRISMYRSSSDRFSRDAIRLMYNNWVKNLTLKYSTDILSNSIAAFNYFYPNIWNTDKRFKVIYNGINAEKFTDTKENLRAEFGIPANAFVVGHTGRYNEAKNHKTITKVAKKLIDKHDDIYFILCGNGVKHNLEKEVIELNISDKVLLFENRDDIPRFLNTMNCYFFPSITEGQPNALIEAMVSGLPIVASNIDPIKESTPEEIHKYLKASNNIDGFANEIEEIKDSKTYRTELIHKNWAINRFDYKERFEEFYHIIINEDKE